MKKYTLLLLITCFSFNSFAQDSIVSKIVYKKKTVHHFKKDSTEISPRILSVRKAFKRAIDKKKYQLVFDKTNSYFKEIPIIGNSKNNISLEESYGKTLANSLGDVEGFFYVDTSKNLFLKQLTIGTDLFLVKTTASSVIWDIKMDSVKQIGNYKCYKATTSYDVFSKGNAVERNVTAWFTTDLSYPFGPGRFVGLPGLILELKFETSGIIIYAETIILNQKATKKELLLLKKPLSKGIKVSQEEFDGNLKKLRRAKG